MFVLLGVVIGFAASDLLNMTGLNWANWAAVSLLAGFTAVLVLDGRRNRRS